MVTRRESIGAHYGLSDWLMQRITGVVITLYVLLLLGILLFKPGMDLQGWSELFGRTAFRLVTFAALVSVFLHAWVGMRNILMDYAKPTSVRLALQTIVICALIAYSGWTIQVLWGGT